MSEVKKQWKEREEFSISELDDLWFANRNLEMARSIILAVKDFQKISLEEKLKFLSSIFYEQSNLSRESEIQYIRNIRSSLLDVFLFLLPEWKQEIVDKQYARLILILLSHKDIHHYIRVSTGQIKKFVHSYLNSVRKEDMVEEYLIVDVLINNRMFEELVNYNFVSDGTLARLWEFLFKKNSYGDGSYYYTYTFLQSDNSSLNFIQKSLLSWDKVENRHALSTLWTLLAKRGDLEKIFGTEKTGEIKKVE